MATYRRLCLATALTVVTAACGSSPTAPNLAAVPAPSITTNTGSADTLGLRGRILPTCGIEAVIVSVVPPSGSDREGYQLEATYKGDSANCPAPTWSVFPPAPLVVDPKQPELVTVYDNPENKLGWLDVTATIGSMRLSGTDRVQFPRTGRR